jgi:uncharacterized phage-associated protein
MFSAVLIAEWFVRKGIQEKNPLDLLQIMKLAYIAHGCYLAIEEKPLFKEKVEAWQYGPVVFEIYTEYKRHGKSPIEFPRRFLDMDISHIQSNERVQEVLLDVYNTFADMNSSALIRLTHMAGSPWSEVYKEGKRGIPIGNDLIKNYYKHELST